MTLSLTNLAKAGFVDLSRARELLDELGEETSVPVLSALDALSQAADPDRALEWLLKLSRASKEHNSRIKILMADPASARRLCLLVGGSRGLAEFCERHVFALELFSSPAELPLHQHSLSEELFAELNVRDEVAGIGGEEARTILRSTYRKWLLSIALWDLSHDDPQSQVKAVTQALSDCAGAALEGALAVARCEALSIFSESEVTQTDLAIIAMGKCGARELNYLSDVDVIFVAEPAPDSDISSERALTIATWLAQTVSKVINEPAVEPGLWEVDANLRPEGKDGALVRTLESHRSYYERWAKDWEFQALLKARPIAGSRSLGQAYFEAVSEFVWSSAARSNFVEQVQRMRERVTENIPEAEIEFQIKLGPGGLRDVEFTVQLLQLVHGLTDTSVRTQSTLESIEKLSEGGYIGREDALRFAQNYEFLRVLEHRLQLRNLSRTHLMPQDEEEQRVLARSTGHMANAVEVVTAWQKTKLHVRELHEKLFYRPLLAAVAQLPGESHQLTPEQAQARLAAIGFSDPKGALGHIAALTQGVSRRAAIQRTLLPVMLQWLSEGANPDHGLLTFRILSEELGESPWFLRMLRDSAGAAQRLTTVLSGSRYVSDLMELIPESAAWFADETDLQPTPDEVLDAEVLAIVARHHDDHEAARKAIRSMRRREVLRLAIGFVLSTTTIEQVSSGLSGVTGAALSGYLALALSESEFNPDFAIIGLGRFGGQELGFDSDADVIYVYRPNNKSEGDQAQSRAEQIVLRIAELAEDPRLPFDIDTGLRPEGKNGSPVRSLDSYRAYYDRWSLLWESQALLRARPVSGDPSLIEQMMTLINQVRYPESVSEDDVREIRRIKARVEAERLPQGADPARHVKLGRGSLSDVEWTIQLLQLQYAWNYPALQTTSSIQALRTAALEGLISEDEAHKLISAWVFSSRVRSAITVWSDKATDVLPVDIHDLDGIARLMGYPAGAASTLEEEYLSVTRKSRQVVEKVFFGF